MEALSEENRQAWRVFQAVATRFVADLHAGDTALAWAASEVDEADRGDLLARLAVIYDARYPVRKAD